jgi:hypothetical protein
MKSKYKILFIPTTFLMDSRTKYHLKDRGWWGSYKPKEVFKIDGVLEVPYIWTGINEAYIHYTCKDSPYTYCKHVKFDGNSKNTSIVLSDEDIKGKDDL